MAVVTVTSCYLENELVARALVVNLDFVCFPLDVESHSVLVASVPLRREGDRESSREIGIAVITDVLQVESAARKVSPCPMVLCRRSVRSESRSPIPNCAVEKLEVSDHTIEIIIIGPIRPADVAVDASGITRGQQTMDLLAEKLRVPIDEHLAMLGDSEKPLVFLAYSDRI
eukprot:CAMPEP_0115562878 /NCGR_PEP_ID=MMETSP0271-20121206/101744_1 /TAXON_ID=71861 /ORGANISM="Scrippsiella trochoidea, Strain CCMP3099" /LENGTH=171 /DNA_ID=CAMNT_0002997065 /DNA_START=775 /DNA_END=1290 /DNA_ORIENTATION=+